MVFCGVPFDYLIEFDFSISIHSWFNSMAFGYQEICGAHWEMGSRSIELSIDVVINSQAFVLHTVNTI